MSILGLELLSSLLATKDVKQFLSMGLEADLFKPSEVDIFNYIQTHIKSYGVLPAIPTIVENTGYDLSDFPETIEPPEYYMERVHDRHVSDTLKGVLNDTKDLLMEGKPNEALTLMTEKAVDLWMSANPNEIVDFREALTPVTKEYKKKLGALDEYGIKMGWPYLDDMTGGLQGGDMVSYVGRPAMGKTFNMLYTAQYIWYQQKKRVLMFSMEMIPLLLLQRLSAMHAHLNLTAIKNAELTTKGYKKLVKELTLIKNCEAPFWIVDGNMTSSLDDIWRISRQLKPDVILVDGAYLVKSRNAKQDKWGRIAEVAEGLKSEISTDLKVPVIGSYQFKKTTVEKKKKTGDDPGLEDIYGSDVIGQVSSIVLALLEGDSVETLLKRRIDVLKGRSGETGQFYVNWDFQNMMFDQWNEPKLSDLQFI